MNCKFQKGLIDCLDCFPIDFIILECHIENRWYDTHKYSVTSHSKAVLTLVAVGTINI